MEHEDECQKAIFPGYDRSDSETMSITTSVLSGTVGEGRRTYAVYGQEEYGFPMDAGELERVDQSHNIYYALLDKQLFLSPLPARPERILDLGCGTGTWAIAVADRYPYTDVLGVDIAPTQPELVPPNCTFEIDDIERDWIYPPGMADFIFGRDLITGIRNYPRLIDQAFTHLKPGGWLELQSISPMLGCDDGSVPLNSRCKIMSERLIEACVPWGTPADDPSRWQRWMMERGFVNVSSRVFKVPNGPWSQEPRLKLVGTWQRHSLLQHLEGLLFRLLQRGLGWTEEEVVIFAAHVREELKDDSMHSWWPFMVVYGQKPERPQPKTGRYARTI